MIADTMNLLRFRIYAWSRNRPVLTVWDFFNLW